VNELVPMADVERMAGAMSRSGLFSKSPEQALALMLIAQAEGLHPAAAMQEYDVIQGRPAINSRSALARFQAAGGTIQWKKRTDTEAEATFTHPQGGSLTVRWDMARAAQAGLNGKDNWKKFPAQMLSARVIAEGVRAVYPACLSRLYTVEEVQDFEVPHAAPVPEEPRNVTEEPATIVRDDPATKLQGELADFLNSGELGVAAMNTIREALERDERDIATLEDLAIRARKYVAAKRAKEAERA
jgi:hypothetical protein